MIALNNTKDAAICTHCLFFKVKKVSHKHCTSFLASTHHNECIVITVTKNGETKHELYRPGIYSTAGENGKLFTLAKN